MTATSTIHAIWRKTIDQQVHLRVIQSPVLTTIELRDWNETSRTYGRGIWAADTPAVRDILHRAAHTPDLPPMGPIPAVGPTILATIEQSPGAVLHLRSISVDGTPALEFREHRNGADFKGYWIPFNAIADQILLTASAHNNLERAA